MISVGDVPASNPYNMRLVILQNLFESQDSNGTKGNSVRAALRRNSVDCTHDTGKTLEIIRCIIQESINLEIQAIIDKYVEKFFQPAIRNIKRNNANINEDHLSTVCCKILEEAKCIYFSPTAALEEPLQKPETSAPLINKNIPSHLRRYYYQEKDKNVDSDTESELSQISTSYRPRKRPVRLLSPSDVTAGPSPSRSATPSGVMSAPPTVNDLEKWNPDRISGETRFILGSKANKILGMSQRGRIYFKHPNLFRYVGDNHDKLWLYERSHTSRAGGRAFFLLLEDIIELAEMPEYKITAVAGISQLENDSFIVPEFIGKKICDFMSGVYSQMRNRLGPIIPSSEPQIPVKDEPNSPAGSGNS